jgi:formylglycine-generating enzyme required for sulfatase activity
MDQRTDTLCPGCFSEKGRTSYCPYCGYDETVERGPLVLPHRTLLHGQFVVGRVLGKPGGFGITYLGWDLNLQTRVAIKEFLPRDLAGRSAVRATVDVHSHDEGEQFRFGLEQFLREARTLAQLDHPNIVRVRQFFEANGTAYLVMDYYQGFSLAEYLDQQGGRIPEEQAKQLMLPILDGLRAVHAKGFLHRDIKPQNIYLARLDSGGVRPILLDFGAARQAMGERSRSLSVVISPGYAPFEQYHRKGKQGPWTDIYSAAAVLYRMVTGEAPPEANERMVGDDLKPAAAFGVSKQLSDALGEALAIAAEARPQTVQTFQGEIWSNPTPPVSSASPPPTPRTTARVHHTQPPEPGPGSTHDAPLKPRAGVWLAVVLALGAAGGVGTGLLDRQAAAPETAPRASVEPAPTAKLITPAPATQPPRSPPPTRQPFEPQMIRIPAGSFSMGCQPKENECSDDEKPAHRVWVAAFELGKYEVTVAEWDACVADEVCTHRPDWWRAQHPVIDVSWKDAQQYVNWLARKTGKAYRLPTEAEWEYAARAKTTTPFSTGNCITTDHANYDGRSDYNNCGAKTGGIVGWSQPVGHYPANPWGLHDLHGNVDEWVEDCWHDNYIGAPTDGSAWAQGSCQARVLRGGSWNSYPRFLRSAVRGSNDSGNRGDTLGFRVARTLTP